MELEILLDEPITAHVKGQSVDVDVLQFNAPTPAMRKIRTKMVGIMLGAMMDAGKRFQGFGDKDTPEGPADTADGLKLDADAVLTMLYAVDDGEPMVKMQDMFDRLIEVPGIAFFHDSKEAMSKGVWDKVKDQDAVIGEYLANFIIPALDTMTTKRH